MPNNDLVYNETFSADGRLLAGEGEGYQSDIYLWNVVARRYITTLSVPNAETAYGALAFGPDGKTLTFADRSGTAYRWNLSTFSRSVVHVGTNYNVSSNVALSGDANILAVSNHSNTGITVWNLRTSTAVASLSIPGTARMFNDTGFVGDNSAISLDNSGRLLAASDIHGNTYIFDVYAQQVTFTLRFDALSYGTAAPVISPDGKTIEEWGIQVGDQARLWDIASKSNVTPTDLHWSTEVTFQGYSTDGGVIVNYFGEGDADLWNNETGTHITTVAVPQVSIIFAVSPGGKELVISAGHQLLFFNGAQTIGLPGINPSLGAANDRRLLCAVQDEHGGIIGVE